MTEGVPFENRTAEATTDWNNEDDNTHASSAAATNKDKLNNIQRILLGKRQGDDLQRENEGVNLIRKLYGMFVLLMNSIIKCYLLSAIVSDDFFFACSSS
jgi:hypothetical protein